MPTGLLLVGECLAEPPKHRANAFDTTLPDMDSWSPLAGRSIGRMIEED